MKHRLIALLLVIATMLSMMGSAVPTTLGEGAVSDDAAAAVEAVAPADSGADADGFCTLCTPVLVDNTFYHAEDCVYAYDGDAEQVVGKYIAPLDNGYIFVSDSYAGDELYFAYEEFLEDTVYRVTDWYWNGSSTAVWFKVELYSGGVIEEVADLWPEEAWVLYDYTIENNPSFAFVTVDEPDTETEYDIYCYICGAVNCTAAHVYCCTCGTYDCGLEHEDIYAHPTAPVIPDYTLPEGEAMAVVDGDGNAVTAESGFAISMGFEHSLSAFVPENTFTNVSYQWQVRYDAANDLWVNIQGQTNQGILMSYAMFKSVLETAGSAAIRCVVTCDGTELVSDAIPVTVSGSTAGGSASGSDAAAQAEGDGGDLTTVTLMIEYRYRIESSGKDGTIAANPWVATLSVGNARSDTVNMPVIPGYYPVFTDTENASLAKNTEGKYQMTLNYPNGIFENTTLTVFYLPDDVPVTVKHLWQNVNDDNYTLHETTTLSLKTGSLVGDVHNTYEGFFNLLYEKPEVAADGSTVVEVRYNRVYHLMKFVLGGGYGAEPIYARYGEEIQAGYPKRAGYAFMGWGDANGNPVTIPDTMPASNQTYYALWKELDTNYTVVYWTVNNDGTRSLIGTHIEKSTTGATVNGVGNLHTEDGYICNEESTHVHTKDCYSCGMEAHSHANPCFSHTPISNIPGSNGEAVINAVENGTGPKHGYIYVIKHEGTGNLWPKLCLNGLYYTLNNIGKDNPATEEQIATLVEGAALGTATMAFSNETLSVTKYKAKTICGTEQHDHVATCGPICNEHEHDEDECYVDDLRLKYLYAVDSVTVTKADGTTVTYTTDKNVTVSGDGTTTVNVYYQYKEYTLKFYYAASTGTTRKTYKIVGGTSYYFGKQSGTDTSDDEILLESIWRQTGQWGTVDELPTLNSRGNSRNYTQGSVTYNYNGTPVTYYYISFKARYGDDISDLWPCAVFNSVTRTSANTHGNWAGREAFVSAWNGEYRVKYSQDNANETIKGIYEKLDENLLFHQRYTDETEVSYICFWENGANINWSVPELYRYNIWLETYTGQDLTDKQTKLRNGVTYYLADSYDTCDDSNVDSQTQVSLTGYKANGRDSSRITDFDTKLYKEAWNVNFYYLAERYPLIFWNHDDFLVEGKGSEVAYDSPLEKHFEGITVNGVEYEGANDLIAKPEYYPKTLEPGAYWFEGWYTSPTFHAETKVDPATMTMPDEPLRVYARWLPKTYTVNILDKINGSHIEDSPYTVSHGTTVPGSWDDYEPTPPVGMEQYDFVGWFYVNDKGVETAFDPANIPVTQNMDVYAKWSSNVLVAYTVKFVLDENMNGVHDDDETTYVADTITGSALAGTSKTFDAKGGSELYTAYQEGHFPGVDSHTLTFSPTDDAENSFTFLYVPVEKVSYTVRYMNRATNTNVFDEVTVEADVNDENTKAIVTVNFKPISGYMPEEYQITKPIVATGENVITFWYNKDIQHALYQVNHYIQNLDGTTWAVHESDTITGDIGEDYSANPISIAGFTFDATATQNNLSSGTTLSGTTVSGTLTANGMQLNLYYSRNMYPYEIYYLDYVTHDVLMGPANDDDAAGKDFAGNAYFGQLLSHTADYIYSNEGGIEQFELYETEPVVKTKIIEIDGIDGGKVEKNILVYYYTRCTQNLTVTKAVSGDVADPDRVYYFTLTIDPDYAFHETSYKVGDVYQSPAEDADGKPSTLSFSLRQGDTITIEGLPTAIYTIEELTHSIDNYYAYFTPNTNGGKERLTFILAQNKTTAVTCTNYTLGDLYLEKELEPAKDFDPDDLPMDTKFKFTIIPVGTFPTWENTFDVTYSPASFSDGTATPTTVNMVGGMLTLEIQAGQSVVIEDLPAVTYRVIEESQPSYANNFAVMENSDWVPRSPQQTNGNLYTDVAIKEGQLTQVLCTNIYPVDRAELIIQNVVSGVDANDAQLAGMTFNYSVSFPEEDLVEYTYIIYNADGSKFEEGKVKSADKKAFSITLKAGQYVVVPSMPDGGYTITQTASVSGLKTSYEVYMTNCGDDISTTVNKIGNPQITGSGNGFSDEFAAKKSYSVIFTNLVRGELTIRKLVDGKLYDDGDTFVFTVTGDAGTGNYSKVVAINGSGSVTLTDLPVGTYTVTEDTDWSWRYAAAYKVGEQETNQVEISLGALEPVMTVTNACTKHQWLSDMAYKLNTFGIRTNH